MKPHPPSCYGSVVGRTLTPAEPRALCLRCRRPKAVCFCGAVTRVESRTRVIFVQHPLEAKVPISTCRMAHLSLPNSELHVELNPDQLPRLQALAAEPGTYLLFPGEGAADPTTLSQPVRNLVVVDGTWDNAKKLLLRSPLLSKLPRLGLRPAAPGNYRIRKEPADHCLATIEAVAQVLEQLEGAPGRFTAILSAFDAMVERQLGFISSKAGQSRYQRLRRRNPGHSKLERLGELAPKLVLAFGEANAWPRDLEVPGYAELLHLAAVRYATGERFQAVLKPRRPLSPVAASHLGLPEDAFVSGEDAASAVRRFLDFVGDGVLGVWGPYTVDLLKGEGVEVPRVFDLRAFLSQLSSRRPGAVDELAVAKGATLPAAPRALRRVEAMRAVFPLPQAGEGGRRPGEGGSPKASDFLTEIA